MAPRSIWELFRSTVARDPEGTAYRYKKDGRWHDVSWSEAERTVRRIARALIALGVEKGDRVAILSSTRLEWLLSDLGIACGGMVTVGIYPSNLAADCAYIVNHSDSEVVLVEDRIQLDKLWSVRDEIASVRHFVVFDGESDPERNALCWNDFLAGADGVPEDRFDERAATIQPGDLASLVYTSGTTGVPKGAMITHDNLVFTSDSAAQCLPMNRGYVTLLFLPLAHVFARIIAYSSLARGVTVAAAESLEKVAENLRETRPHFIASVPRVYEKVHDRIISRVQEAGGLKEKLFRWALGVGLQVSRLKQKSKPVPGWLAFRYAVATRLVFRKIQESLGGRLLWTVSGAAPLDRNLAEFFHACGILILEGLGMTENTSFSNVNQADRYRFGTVGPAGPGIEVKIAKDGEILFRGRNVMKGYFKDEAGTAETIDEDGWLHTGDIGELDEDGFLRVTDRKKDIIITAGGKNIAPQRIEQALQSSPYIAQSLVYGDRRKYLVALVTLDADRVAAWARQQGIAFDRPETLAGNPRVHVLIEQEVEKSNRQLASFESVKKVRVLPDQFAVEGGELTPTMKVKRPVVVERHRHLIEEMYAD